MKEYCFHFHDFEYDPDTDIVDCRFCGKKWHPAPEPTPSSQQKTKPSLDELESINSEPGAVEDAIISGFNESQEELERQRRSK